MIRLRAYCLLGILLYASLCGRQLNHFSTVAMRASVSEHLFIPPLIPNLESRALPVKRSDCSVGEEQMVLELIYNEIERTAERLMELSHHGSTTHKS